MAQTVSDCTGRTSDLSDIAYINHEQWEHGEGVANAHLIASAPDLLLALFAYEAMREEMFAQCLSNPIYDAWGKPIDLTLLNKAHFLALNAIEQAKGHK